MSFQSGRRRRRGGPEESLTRIQGRTMQRARSPPSPSPMTLDPVTVDNRLQGLLDAHKPASRVDSTGVSSIDGPSSNAQDTTPGTPIEDCPELSLNSSWTHLSVPANARDRIWHDEEASAPTSLSAAFNDFSDELIPLPLSNAAHNEQVYEAASSHASSAPVKRLACPFYQRDPPRHRARACRGDGFQNWSRLKHSHLERNHKMPIKCPRCFAEFVMATDRDAHLNEEPVCDRRSQPFDDRISCNTWGALKDRARFAGAKTEEEKWVIGYRIMFPNDKFVPSPYYSAASNDAFREYHDHLRVHLPQLLRNQLENKMTSHPPLSSESFNASYDEALQQSVVEALEDALYIYRTRNDGGVPLASVGEAESIYGTASTDISSYGDVSSHGSSSITGPSESGNIPSDVRHGVLSLANLRGLRLASGEAHPGGRFVSSNRDSHMPSTLLLSQSSGFVGTDPALAVATGPANSFSLHAPSETRYDHRMRHVQSFRAMASTVDGAMAGMRPTINPSELRAGASNIGTRSDDLNILRPASAQSNTTDATLFDETMLLDGNADGPDVRYARVEQHENTSWDHPMQLQF